MFTSQPNVGYFVIRMFRYFLFYWNSDKKYWLKMTCMVLYAFLQKAVFCSIKTGLNISGITDLWLHMLRCCYMRGGRCVYISSVRRFVCTPSLHSSKLFPFTGAVRAVSHSQWKRAHKQKFNFTQGHKLIGKCLLILIVILSFLHLPSATFISVSLPRAVAAECGGSGDAGLKMLFSNCIWGLQRPILKHCP